MPAGRGRGFTLIEVMVALAVVATALPALLFALQQQVDGAASLRDRSQATVIAANKLVEARLLAREGRVPDRATEGESELAGRRWRWWLEVEGTEVPRFTRVEIRVAAEAAERERALVTLVGFVTAPEGAGGS